MQIADNTIVTLNYTLTDNDGNQIDQSIDGSFAYLHGASNIIVGLESALLGKVAGDAMSVSVEPSEAYGDYDAELVETVGRDMFPADTKIEAGVQFHAESAEGEMMVVQVKAVENDKVTIDSNHPLAGVALNFDVKVIDVRQASADELSHGHAHGPDGHATH